MKGLNYNQESDGSGKIETTKVSDTQQKTEVNQEAQPPQQESAFNFSETTGGRFESADKIKEFFDTFDKNYVEASKYAEHIPSKEAYANPFVKELNDLIKGNATPEQVKMFFDLSFVDTDKMDTREAMALSMALTDGISLSSAKALIEDSYPTFEDYVKNENIDEYDDDAMAKAKRKYAIIEAKMERDGKNAKTNILSKKQDIFSGIKSQDEIKAEQEQNLTNAKQAWSGNNDFKASFEKSLTKIDFAYKKGDNEYSIQIPIESKAFDKLYKDAVDFAINGNVSPTKENIEAIINIAKESYIGKNFASILETIIEDNTSKVTERIANENSGQKVKREQGVFRKENTSSVGGFYR